MHLLILVFVQPRWKVIDHVSYNTYLILKKKILKTYVEENDSLCVAQRQMHIFKKQIQNMVSNIYGLQRKNRAYWTKVCSKKTTKWGNIDSTVEIIANDPEHMFEPSTLTNKVHDIICLNNMTFKMNSYINLPTIQSNKMTFANWQKNHSSSP